MVETVAADVHPPYLYPAYKSTQLRAPSRSRLVRVAPSPLEAVGPVFPKHFVKDSEVDLTTWGKSAPLGEKMVLVGRVLDEDGRPVRRSLIEVWQANASGKYPHPVDDHEAPLDPNFLGMGQLLTDDEGRYRIVTVKPGAYPWQNHAFGWRPAHIHLSLFGNAYAQRLITQMFFPGDPLAGHRSDLQQRSRGRTRASDCGSRSRARYRGCGARVPVRHHPARAGGHADGDVIMAKPTPSQTVGPFFARELLWSDGVRSVPGHGNRTTLDGTGVRRQWRSHRRCPHGDLAGGRGRTLAPGSDGARPCGYGRVSTDTDGRVYDRDHHARLVQGPGRRNVRPSDQRDDFRPRTPEG